ncbi:TonB-dependent receptor plug domain-containing protein [Alishewanella sp. d11]|uniref:TonB-dependent receptor plug domain-containing protein n=1 Tax=Alishewanella sp. d11 TaxID=3414030 RepID=UPI003BF7E0BC
MNKPKYYHPVSRAVKYALTSSLALGVYSSSVLADETVAAETKVEKIAVVGTRLAPRSIADSPVPVDIIDGDELMKNGSSDMLNMLTTTIPSLNVHANPISDTATLTRPVNLRGLSSDSTLVLLNGKRRHRASVITFLGGGINDGAQGPDISVIPGIALKQVEVLRDGAAAQYGSDAIAGVINFVLKDNADGGTIEVKQGEYYEGDGSSTELAANFGMPLTQDGFVNVSLQYKNVDPTSRSVQRGDAATLAAQGNPDIAPIAQIWGSPEVKDDFTFFFNSGLELGNDRSAYLFGNYAERDVVGGFYYRNPHTRGGVFSNDGGRTLEVIDTTGAGNCANVSLFDGDRKLNHGEITARVGALPSNCFTFFSMFPGGFTPNFGGNITDTSLTAGTKGEFKEGVFKGVFYDFYGSVGRNESAFNIVNTVNASLGPETPTAFDAGKYVQLEKNFGADFVKYIEAGLYNDLAIAAGVQWAEETFEIIAGETASWEVGPYVSQLTNGSNGFPGFQPDNAGVNVRRNYAAYIDAEAELSENLLVAAALRYEDYDSFGNTTNYKVTGQYRLTEDLAIRGSHSTGFRAPTVGQANVSNVRTAIIGGELVDIGLLPPTNPVSVLKGGKELTPEESRSYTLGLVYSGSGGIFFTADLFRIEVDDRIGQSREFAVTQADRDQLKAAGVRGIDSLSQLTYLTNDFDTVTTGFDLVANYSTNLFDGRSSFSLAYNWTDTEVKRFTDVTGAFKVSRLENDLPNHRATLTWNQQWESIDMFVRTNYFGEYQGVHADSDEWVTQASAKVTFDVEAAYHFNESFTVAVGAQNLFDTKAERIPDNISSILGAKYFETSPMGINGGYYYLKGIYRF